MTDEIIARQAAQAIEIATRMTTGGPYTDSDVHQLAESALYALSSKMNDVTDDMVTAAFEKLLGRPCEAVSRQDVHAALTAAIARKRDNADALGHYQATLDAAVLARKPVGNVETIADAIDDARFKHPVYGRERPRPFAEADKSDREYALRLARAAMRAAALEPPPNNFTIPA